MGCGLAFCKLEIEQLGGRIWADQSPLGGTRIAFELPHVPALSLVQASESPGAWSAHGEQRAHARPTPIAVPRSA